MIHPFDAMLAAIGVSQGPSPVDPKQECNVMRAALDALDAALGRRDWGGVRAAAAMLRDKLDRHEEGLT